MRGHNTRPRVAVLSMSERGTSFMHLRIYTDFLLASRRGHGAARVVVHGRLHDRANRAAASELASVSTQTHSAPRA